jgi:CDP-diacylglycerol--glycerol-3-phosphate 3-phosphatidyltransferase
MCHPWLATGVAGFMGVVLVRELVPVLLARDAEAPAARTGFLGAAVRAWFRRRLEPLVDYLLAAGVSANLVTGVQLVLSVLCAAAYAVGWLFSAGWLLLASGSLDVIDGAMARKGGVAGPRGAFIDSVVDRYGESAVFIGLAIYFRYDWPLWLVLVAFLGGFMVSYSRARAESLGADCSVGFTQRPERYVILGGGSMFGTLAAHLACDPGVGRGALIVSLVVVAALANLTALQRVVFTVRQLS